MKKVVCLFLLICSGSILAQTTDASTTNTTTFGIKGGVSYANLHGNMSYSNGSSGNGLSDTNFYVGLFAETTLNNRWAIGNEILFSYTDDIHYIEIPVHVKYKFWKKFQVFAGPKLDFVLANTNNITTWQVNNTLGISADVGLQYQITKHLFTELRYSYGFTKQLTDPGTYSDAQRNTLRLGVGLQL